MPRRSLALVVFPFLIAACGKAPEPAVQQPPPASLAEVQKHMDDHFGRVREVEDAVIRGDLEAAKTPALWIADHQETTGLPAGTDSRVIAMKNSAKSVASSANIENAAIATAALIGACGGCHADARVSPRLPEVSEPTARAKLPGHMLEHQHAIELMYRGLVSPASGDWMRGAEALKTATLGGKSVPDASAEAVAAEARVHELAQRAMDAPSMSSRVTIYGSLIGGCANCHSLHGRVFGPGVKTQ